MSLEELEEQLEKLEFNALVSRMLIIHLLLQIHPQKRKELLDTMDDFKALLRGNIRDDLPLTEFEVYGKFKDFLDTY